MFRVSQCLILLAILTAFVATPASSQQVPDPQQSSCDQYVGASPKNNAPNLPSQYRYAFNVMLRDAQGNAVVGWPASQLRLNFASTINPGHPQFAHPDGPSVAMGLVSFRDHLDFGGADPGPVTLECDPTGAGTTWVVLATAPGASTTSCGGVRSPDVNGDGVIGLSDLALWQQAFILGGPIAVGDLAETFDCSISLNDLAWWQVHFII